MADEDQPERFEPAVSVDQLTKKLAKFIENNPEAVIDRLEVDKGSLNQIRMPWGDPTLIYLFPDDPTEIIKVLNKVVLPSRFSAIWHQDTGDLEVLWTAHPLSEAQEEIHGRKFEFSYNKKKYQCEFGMSSERLLSLTKGIIPITNASLTNHRNTESFYRYSNRRNKDNPGLSTPKSFWIRKMRLSESAAVEMIRHLNFYLNYYDSESPYVLIHNPSAPDKINRKLRFAHGNFPSQIGSRQLDENLLVFWSAAGAGNMMLRYILYYRIIEYAAFHFMDAGLRAKLRRILADPALCNALDPAVERVLGIMDVKKADDIPRFNALLTNAVRADKIWKEIENNRQHFSQTLKFDGGFVLEPIISKDEKLSNFETGGMVKIADALRKIRNVLSHGRDQNTSTAITPTAKNFKNLLPWVNVVCAAAGEVVLYESVT